MATSRLCSIPNCGKTSHARGMCAGHDHRMRKYGDPLAGGPAKGDAVRFLEFAKAYAGDDCLYWPYSGNGVGYGTIRHNGMTTYAHRLVCEAVNGEAPSPQHEAAHSCGNGDKGCVAGTHLLWKTRVDNQADRIGHGTHMAGEKHGRSKLTKEQVEKIRLLRGKKSQREIAEEFSISQPHVSEIHSGNKWAKIEQVN